MTPLGPLESLTSWTSIASSGQTQVIVESLLTVSFVGAKKLSPSSTFLRCGFPEPAVGRRRPEEGDAGDQRADDGALHGL